jgi:peptide/nickel transport system substrate-binding protein
MRRAGIFRLLLGAAIAVASLVGVWAGTTASKAARPEPTVLRATFTSFPDYLDPQLSYTYEGWTAMYDTYIPLLTFRHAGGRAGAEVVPGLAAGMPEISDGGRTYTLFLRQGLKYSDGTPVKASDFEYSIERALKMFSPGESFYLGIVGAGRVAEGGRGGIRGIVANDLSGEIVIHLAAPDGAFTDALALPFAAPVPQSTPISDQSASPPPATGPYAITSSRPGRGWSYIRNPVWLSDNGRLIPELPGGQMDRIEVRVVHSAEKQVKAVLAGKVDWMQGQPPATRLPEIRRKYSGAQFRVEPTLSTDYFWMNTTKAPFNDLRVRTAANLAVDRSVLRRIYGGQLIPSQQVLPPGLPGHRKLELFPFDMARARRLVAVADPADRIVTVWAPRESPTGQAASYYRRQLEKIGFNARLKLVNPDNYFVTIGSLSAPDLDTGWSDWFADYPHPGNFFRSTLHGSSIHPVFNENFAQIDVPTLDARIDRLGKRPLGPALEREYAALDSSYMKLAPWVSYGNRTLTTLVSRTVDLNGVVWNPIIGADLTSFRFR